MPCMSKDLDGRYLMANAGTAAYVGRPVDQIVGYDDTVLFEPDSARRIREGDVAIMAANATSTSEEPLVTQDGKEWLFLVTKGPMHDAHGQVNGLFGLSRDITEIHQARQAPAEPARTSGSPGQSPHGGTGNGPP